MSNSRKLVVLSLAVIVLISGFAVGQEVEVKKKIKVIKDGEMINITDGHGDCLGDCNMHVGHLSMCALDLDEKQEKKVDKLHKDLEKTLLPMNADMKVKEAELDKLLIAAKPSKSAINQKIDEIGALEVKMQKEKVGHRLAVRALLNEDQKLKFDKMGGCCGSEGTVHKKMMFIGEGGKDIDVIKLQGLHGIGEHEKIIELMHDGDAEGHKVMKWTDEDGNHTVKRWVTKDGKEKEIRLEVEVEDEKKKEK